MGGHGVDKECVVGACKKYFAPIAIAVALLATPSAALAQSPGSISGTITDSQGNPVQGACVSINGGGLQWWELPEGYSDDDGKYELEDVPPATYELYVQPCNGQNLVRKTIQVTLAAGEAKTGVDVSMLKGGTIRGRVTGVGGVPLEQVLVQASDSPGLYTDADGRYEVTGVPPGAIKVSFYPFAHDGYWFQFYGGGMMYETAQAIQMSEGEVRDGIDVQLSKGSGIAGTVVDAAGNPLEGICVSGIVPETLAPPFIVKTRADGTYFLGPLRPGTYRVQFQDCHDWNTSMLSQTRLIDVGEEPTTGVDATMIEGGRIAGTVVDFNGQPMQGVCVRARGSLPGSFGQAITEADGSFRTGGMPDDRYLVTFTNCNPAGPMITQYFQEQSVPEKATPIDIVGGQSRLDIHTRLVASPKACVVPELIGSRLVGAGNAIDDTTCELGAVKRKKSTKPVDAF